MVEYIRNLVTNVVDKTPITPPTQLQNQGRITPGGVPSNFIPPQFRPAEQTLKYAGVKTPDTVWVKGRPPKVFKKSIVTQPHQHLMEQDLVKDLFK